MSVYLDYNASTPINLDVLQIMNDVYKNHFGNADSRTHLEGSTAKEIIEKARNQVARLLDVNPFEICFTSGATESNNIAILGMAKWGKIIGKTHIITSSIEHKAILEPIRYLESKGYDVDYLDPISDGYIDPNMIESKIRPNTLMLCLMHANNETGIIQPIREIGNLLQEKEVYYLIDAAQTFGKLVEDISSSSYNFLSASAHKFHGPQGIGVLTIRYKGSLRPPLSPIMFGGGQENGLRPGTLPVALIAGMGYAAELALKTHNEWKNRTKTIKQQVVSLIEQADIRYKINGNQKYCMTNTLNISFLGVDSEALMLALKGKCSFSNGSACTAKSYEPSHVLLRMGYNEERIESAVRLSWDVEDISIGINEIINMVKQLQ